MLTRDLYIPLLDVNLGEGTPEWVPFDKSTIFDFAWNPTTETYGYICNRLDSTEVTGFAPSLPQEIILDNTNPMYEFLRQQFFKFDVDALKVPFLLAMPDSTGSVAIGYVWDEAVLVPSDLNSVDHKLSLTVQLNGDPTEGTVTVAEDGTITFTEATA